MQPRDHALAVTLVLCAEHGVPERPFGHDDIRPLHHFERLLRIVIVMAGPVILFEFEQAGGLEMRLERIPELLVVTTDKYFAFAGLHLLVTVDIKRGRGRRRMRSDAPTRVNQIWIVAILLRSTTSGNFATSGK